MKDHIATTSTGWNRVEPRFILIQVQPWTDVKPRNFKNVAASLNDDYVVVRPDHLFQLLSETQSISSVNTAALARTDSTEIVHEETKLSVFQNHAAVSNFQDHNFKISDKNSTAISTLSFFSVSFIQYSLPC